MKNNIVIVLFIMGLSLLVKLLALPVALAIEYYCNDTCIRIFYFIFDYGAFIISIIILVFIALLKKENIITGWINRNFVKSKNYFVVIGWIPIVLFLNSKLIGYFSYAVIISLIFAVAGDKRIILSDRVIYIIFLIFLILLFVVSGYLYDWYEE